MAQQSSRSSSASHRTKDELMACMDTIRQAPADNGTVRLVVRRPQENRREVLGEGFFDQADGLAGDTWRKRRSLRTSDGSPHPDMQLTLMGVRAIEAICPDETRWSLAGDQLFVDLDLTQVNSPTGRELNLRGIYARVASPGRIRPGDAITKLL